MHQIFKQGSTYRHQQNSWEITNRTSVHISHLHKRDQDKYSQSTKIKGVITRKDKHAITLTQLPNELRSDALRIIQISDFRLKESSRPTVTKYKEIAETSATEYEKEYVGLSSEDREKQECLKK